MIILKYGIGIFRSDYLNLLFNIFFMVLLQTLYCFINNRISKYSEIIDTWTIIAHELSTVAET